jgi:uncharacterized protein YbjT (DUF2867 family)
MTRTLVIGATGTIGRPVAAQLAAAGVQVRALARNPATARLPPEVEVVQGDLTVPATLERSLDDVQAVFLVWTAPRTALDAALDVIAAHVRRLVLLSAPIKTPHPFFQQPNPARDLAAAIEGRIERSALEWTFLRPHMFAANSRHFWGPQLRAGDLVRWPYLSAPTAPIDERDIAAVAVRTLTEDGHGGRDYVLTGPQSLTQREQIAIIGEAIARPLRIEEISPDEARQVLLPSTPRPAVDMLLNAWAAALGQPAFVTTTVADLTAAPARTFAQWAADNAASFTS